MTTISVGVPVTAGADLIRYVSVSAGTQTTYLVRSDGSVDRTKGGGKISKRLSPADPKTKYIMASAGLCLPRTEHQTVMPASPPSALLMV
jgi:hypothetical protein